MNASNVEHNLMDYGFHIPLLCSAEAFAGILYLLFMSYVYSNFQNVPPMHL